MIDYRKIDSICLIFLHGIGDFVMLTPTLKKIKEINPSLRLGIVLRKELGLRGIAESVGFIDEIYEISLKVHPKIYVPWIFWTHEYWQIKKKVNEALKAAQSFKKIKFIYTQLMPTIFYMVFRPDKFRMHKIERFASELLVPLDEAERNNTYLKVPMTILKDVRERLFHYTGNTGVKVIGIQRNTLDRGKFVPILIVQEFINRLNEKRKDIYFMVFADRHSYRLEEEIDGRHLSAPNLIYSFDIIGSGDTLTLAALVDICDCVLSIDSAVFNMAGALGKKTIGVFNTYKVKSDMISLKKNNIICIDKSNITVNDLLTRLDFLSADRPEQ